MLIRFFSFPFLVAAVSKSLSFFYFLIYFPSFSLAITFPFHLLGRNLSQKLPLAAETSSPRS